MAKQNEAQKEIQEELKKFWEQTKINLAKLAKETRKLAQKGEKEVIRVSKVGKLHLDVLGLKKKRDNLAQQIGEKIIELDSENKIELTELKPLCDKVRTLDGQIQKKKATASRIKKSKSGSK